LDAGQYGFYIPEGTWQDIASLSGADGFCGLLADGKYSTGKNS